MRWRLIDSIEDVDAWTSIRGRKTVSLEEYSLLEPLGRKGHFPESLVLECGVHLVRWLAAASSDFEQSCTLLEVGPFVFEHETSPGNTLTVSATVLEKQNDRLEVECRVAIGSQPYAHGRLALSLLPLKEMDLADNARTLWRELYAKA